MSCISLHASPFTRMLPPSLRVVTLGFVTSVLRVGASTETDHPLGRYNSSDKSCQVHDDRGVCWDDPRPAGDVALIQDVDYPVGCYRSWDNCCKVQDNHHNCWDIFRPAGDVPLAVEEVKSKSVVPDPAHSCRPPRSLTCRRSTFEVQFHVVRNPDTKPIARPHIYQFA